MLAKVFTSYIWIDVCSNLLSTWILYVKGISLAPWQHMMSRLLPATLLFQGYFRQHQGSKPFKDSKQKQTLKWLWIKQIYFIQNSLKMMIFWNLQGCKCCRNDLEKIIYNYNWSYYVFLSNFNTCCLWIQLINQWNIRFSTLIKWKICYIIPAHDQR